MSPRLPRLTAREVVQIIESKGFQYDRQTGSHAVFSHMDGRHVTVPMHNTRTIGVGLLMWILHDADINPDDPRV